MDLIGMIPLFVVSETESMLMLAANCASALFSVVHCAQEWKELRRKTRELWGNLRLS